MTMRVACVEIRNPVTRELCDQSGWLQVDHEYEVLEVYAYPGERVELRLASDNSGTPALFDSSMFITVDGTLPDSWEVKLEEGGTLRVGPSEWMEPGFWEAYFDRQPHALEVYRRGAQRAL